jgi:prevent-host-death family protein
MGELSVGVRELKARLSQYLREVKAGQTIVITDHGAPVGRIVPAGASVEARIQTMVTAGLAEWNGRKFMPPAPKIVNRNAQLLSDLITEGRERDILGLS